MLYNRVERYDNSYKYNYNFESEIVEAEWGATQLMLTQELREEGIRIPDKVIQNENIKNYLAHSLPHNFVRKFLIITNGFYA